MNTKIADLMSKRVISARPHHTVEHLRELMESNHIAAIPIVGADGEALGIVTNSDLVAELKNGTPASTIMTKEVKAIPAYNDVSAAARAMRRSKIHHVVVTHEKQVIGILSTFDLLKLVEDHRFVMKGAPTANSKSRSNSDDKVSA